MARNTTINDETARKRQEIGLSARRETARSSVMRPPGSSDATSTTDVETNAFDGFGGWWLVFFVSLLTAATFLLVAARFVQSPTDISTVDTQVADITQGRVSLQGVDGLVAKLRSQVGSIYLRKSAPRLFDDFTSAQSLLPEGGDANRLQRVEPSAGVYRMRVESGSAAWSLLGDRSLRLYRLETSVRIVSDYPRSSAGLINRFVDADHFYLFAVDGEGRVQVLRANGKGNWQQLLPWIANKAVNSANIGNVLEIEDRDEEIKFLVNGTPVFVYQIAPEEMGRTGDAGLWIAADGKDLAEAEFDRIRLEPLETPS